MKERDRRKERKSERGPKQSIPPGRPPPPLKLTRRGLEAVVVRGVVDVNLPAARGHGKQPAVLGVLHVRDPSLGVADLCDDGVG